jgi:double-stranded uracil-DNA glycosylase
VAGELRPAFVAVLGLGAYRTAFERPRAGEGPQPDGFGPTAVWMLPNPSGLNAHHQLPDLIERFAELRRASRHPRGWARSRAGSIGD